ncbi:Nagb/rpia/CoA transferase-like protein [Pleurostoma richardsiae]|uniref:5-formyltetrahydrofolate cyclo-ligase n=1 Tax=Pleurostoma richardsiae TaxID=41990 RepID=A0AA38RET2_9PEZI|nr:Nagb/rpia/CoA transferase-like protein [Pleurostoma richardsiae]
MSDEVAEMNPSLYAAKQQLRSAMKQRLSALSHDSVTSQSHAIFNTLLRFKPYVDAKRVSIFLAMPSAEVQTDEIVRHALKDGKQVYVPYLHKPTVQPAGTPPRVMDMVRLTDVHDYESLRRDKWGIPSIDPATVNQRQRVLGDAVEQPSADLSVLDLILMPGVAFDIDEKNGNIRRLGHGKGFYDFFLHRYATRMASVEPRDPPLSLYALALSEQFIPSPSEGTVPVGPFDQPLDGLILGNGEVKLSPPDQNT